MYALTRRIWWVVGAIAALLLLAVVLLIADARSDGPGATAAPALRTSRPTPLEAPLSSLPLPVLADLSPAAQAAMPPPVPPGMRAVDVCGTTPEIVPINADDNEVERRLDAAYRRVSAPPWQDMVVSGDERTRAAGLVMTQDLERLVRLANMTRDPAVYAMAQTACDRAPTVSSGGLSPNDWCSTLSTRQRAALEPNNAAAWLDVAKEALDRNDDAGINDALHRAAQASDFQRHGMAVAAAVDKNLSGAAPATAPNAAAAAADAPDKPSPWIVAAANMGSYAALTQVTLMCHGDALASPERQERCATLAPLLMSRGASLQDVEQGLVIARRLTPDSPALAEQAKLINAITQLGSAAFAPNRAASPYGCGELGKLRGWIRAAHGQGDWPALREAALASAGSTAGLVAKAAGSGSVLLKP
jgi:hypothetical protein